VNVFIWRIGRRKTGRVRRKNVTIAGRCVIPGDRQPSVGCSRIIGMTLCERLPDLVAPQPYAHVVFRRSFPLCIPDGIVVYSCCEGRKAQNGKTKATSTSP
jgi:hypothetical protein